MDNFSRIDLDQTANTVARWFAFLIACCALVLFALVIYRFGENARNGDLIIPFLLYNCSGKFISKNWLARNLFIVLVAFRSVFLCVV